MFQFLTHPVPDAATVETADEKGEPVAFSQFGTFVVGAGKFGGPRNSAKAKLPVDPPARVPDATVSEKTSVDQVRLTVGFSHTFLTGADSMLP